MPGGYWLTAQKLKHLIGCFILSWIFKKIYIFTLRELHLIIPYRSNHFNK
jgi:hypothetical protein